MPIPDAFWEDLPASVTGARTARSKPMSFAVVPPKKGSDPGWVIIGKASDVRRRLKTAKKTGKSSFSVGNAVQGQVEVHGGRLLLIVDDGSDKLLRSGLRKWAASLSAAAKDQGDEPRKAAAKLSALVKKAAVYSLAEAASRPWESDDAAEADAYDEAIFSDDELAKIFGEDWAELREAALDSRDKLDRLKTPPEPPSVSRKALAALKEEVGTALAEGGLDEAFEVLVGSGELLDDIQALAASGVAPGGPLQAAVLEAVGAFGALDDLTRRWTLAVERLEESRETFSALQDEDDEDAEERALLARRHERFGAEAEALEDAYTEAAARCEGLIEQLVSGEEA